MSLNNIIRIIPAVFFFAVPFAAAQQLPNETVIVTANASPVPFENLSRTVQVFDREDIESLSIRNITDVLAHAASVDIRGRSPYGMQSDISIRGSAFSQVLILVDGIPINNSQTGHHNSDFPVQLQNVDRIEVLLGSGSSIHGADAFGGAINIITRHPAERVNGSIAWGQHGLVDGSFAAFLEKGGFKQSVSASGSRSSGFQYDRDFHRVEVSTRMTVGGHSTFFLSHVNKEFGANGFYGPSPSREWTNQTFVAAERNIENSAGNRVAVKGYYRTHGDRFLYDIENPQLFEGRHRTHAAGMQLKTEYRLGNSILMILGGGAGGDWIDSGNLGNHSYARTSLFGEFQWTPGSSAAIYPGLRFDYYSNFGASVNPSLSGSWWVLPRLRLRASLGRAFRIPTFIERYYRDPNHEADAGLKPENAWSADIGAECIPADNWLGSLTVFARRGRNVIDWIRSSESEKWRTSNIRKLRTVGFELSLERSFRSKTHLTARYSYVSSSPDSIDSISKYVLDYARHSWSQSTSFALPFDMGYKQTLSYRRRSDGRSYWQLDGCLEKHFYKFTAALDFTNLLDSRYQEILGVDMPGRWFVVSLRTK
ncbi:MAG: TonB-dependent receptor [Acidobacteria bacterium]|nr:TonB-dependent receptor [Acidobacteriota bacterium]